MNPNFWTLPGCAYPVMENKLFTKILKQVIFYQGWHGDFIEMELKTSFGELLIKMSTAWSMWLFYSIKKL